MHQHEIYSDILCGPPMITDSACLQKLLEKLELFMFAQGIWTNNLLKVAALLNSSGEIAAYLGCGYQISYNTETFTVCTSACQVLTDMNRCKNCISFRDIYLRRSKQDELSTISNSSHINERWLDLHKRLKRHPE